MTIFSDFPWVGSLQVPLLPWDISLLPATIAFIAFSYTRLFYVLDDHIHAIATEDSLV